MVEGAVFLDCGTDLGSSHHVPGEFKFHLVIFQLFDLVIGLSVLEI